MPIAFAMRHDVNSLPASAQVWHIKGQTSGIRLVHGSFQKLYDFHALNSMGSYRVAISAILMFDSNRHPGQCMPQCKIIS